MVDGTHFRARRRPRAEDVGWRALAGALSDVAAMGAEPGEAYLAVVVAARASTSSRCTAGAQALAGECGVTIAGGDLAAGPGADRRRHRHRLGGDAGGRRRPRRRAARRPASASPARSAPRPRAWRGVRRGTVDAPPPPGRGSPRASRSRARRARDDRPLRRARHGRAARRERQRRPARRSTSTGCRSRTARRSSRPPPAARTTSCWPASRRSRGRPAASPGSARSPRAQASSCAAAAAALARPRALASELLAGAGERAGGRWRPRPPGVHFVVLHVDLFHAVPS